MKVKKFVADMIWKFQHGWLILGIFATTLGLTGILYNDYIYPNFKAWGIIRADEFLLGFVYLFIILFSTLLSLGIALDHLAYWREEAQTRYQRDPFIKEFFIPLMKGVHRIEKVLLTKDELEAINEPLDEVIRKIEEWIKK